ncbi:hypothetical protein FOL46_003345 [Perkinsus olseni]|uniref:Solute carrier 38 member n=1 Tax=Perkinsus olseni TaxID=32597 RepID=A0A7J6M3A1_PEROL|nr:hypothetical protein FOL46_003345 [Perkinsus olseni]
MAAPSVKVYVDSDSSSGLDVNNGNGAVCERMERGISLRTFFATCCNSLISQALSIPFMFTTAGWFSFIIQALAASFAFICIQMIRATLNNEKVKQYAEERGVPSFEREYTFLGEFCAGNFGRGAITLLILLEYFSGLITNLGAIGLCAALIAPAISADVWIIIFSAITLIMILVPWLREISAVMGVLAVVGILGSMAAWVGSAFVILPDSHLIENLTAREPLLINLVTAFSLSMWTSADVPSLPPYLGAIRGSTDRRITLTIIICLTLSVVYVYIIGLAGMQICDGVCEDFYPASLAGFHPAALPQWLVYCMYAFILLRMFAILPIVMVPLMVACETVVGRLLSCTKITSKLSRLKGWRLAVRCLLLTVAALGAILVKEELAYSQAIASVLLTSCSLYICPLWFYAYVMRPVGIKLWAVYVSGVLIAAFVVVGTYTSIMGIISGSPGASTERL